MWTWRKVRTVAAGALALVLAGALPGYSQQAKPILVGCPGSFKATPWAQGGLLGTQLGFDEINAAGGVKVGGVSRPVQLLTVDTRDEEPGVPVSESLLAIEKLILDKKVDVMIGGPTMSEASMAVVDLMGKYNMVHLTSMGTWTPGWPKKVGANLKKYHSSFKMTGNVAHVLPSGVDLMESLKKQYGFDTAYVIIQDALFTRNAMEVFSGLAEKRGWKILGKSVVPMGTTDYSPELTKAKNSGAKILLYWWNDPTGSILYKQFVDLEVPMIPVGFSPSTQEHEVYEAMGGKVQYFIFPVGQAGTTSTKLPGATKFQQAFEKKFGRKPFGGAASAYTAAFVLKDAIERAGTLEHDALVAALEKTDYKGISGRVKFDANHECVYSFNPGEGVLMGWSQWIKGKRVSIWPPAAADAEVALPPWMKK